MSFGNTNTLFDLLCMASGTCKMFLEDTRALVNIISDWLPATLLSPTNSSMSFSMFGNRLRVLQTLLGSFLLKRDFVVVSLTIPLDSPGCFSVFVSSKTSRQPFLLLKLVISPHDESFQLGVVILQLFLTRTLN